MLAEEQADAYQDDFRQLLPPGVDFVFPSSVEQALDDIGSGGPLAVIVGMTIDSMEGLEFIAEAMARHRDYSGAFVVLPDKGDPFPPVVQRRDPTTGRSSTEHTDLSEVKALLASLAERSVTAAGNGNGNGRANAAAHGFASKPPGGGVVPRPKRPSSAAAASAFGGGKEDPAAGSRPTQRPAPPASGIDASPTRPAPRGGILAQAQAASADATPAPRAVPAAETETAAAPEPEPAAAEPAPEPEPEPAAATAPGPAPAPEPAAPEPAAADASSEAVAVQPVAEPAEPAASEPSAAGPLEPQTPGAAEGQLQAPSPAAATATAGKPRLPKAAIAALAVGGVLGLLVIVVAIALLASGGDEPEASEPASAPTGAAHPASSAADEGDSPSEPATREEQPPAADSVATTGAEPSDGEEADHAETGTVQEGVGSPFDELTAMPLRFDQGEPGFRVEDPAEVEQMVADVARAMQEHPSAKLEVGGHTSGEGTEEYNRALGLRRAVRVRRQLEQRGIASDRIVVRTYGASEPAADDPEAAANRRVTLRLLR